MFGSKYKKQNEVLRETVNILEDIIAEKNKSISILQSSLDEAGQYNKDCYDKYMTLADEFKKIDEAGFASLELEKSMQELMTHSFESIKSILEMVSDEVSGDTLMSIQGKLEKFANDNQLMGQEIDRLVDYRASLFGHKVKRNRKK